MESKRVGKDENLNRVLGRCALACAKVCSIDNN